VIDILPNWRVVPGASYARDHPVAAFQSHRCLAAQEEYRLAAEYVRATGKKAGVAFIL
jgi:hypothetical protein